MSKREISPTRTAQFVNDRLLLERRETDYGVIFYDLYDITVGKVHIAISKEEFEEIERIIDSGFAIPERKPKQEVDDNIPF